MISVNWDELFKLIGQIACGVICCGVPALFVLYPIVMVRGFSGNWPWSGMRRRRRQ